MIIKAYLKHVRLRQPAIQTVRNIFTQPLDGRKALGCESLLLVEHTFEPVCFFVSDQTDAADVEFFEDLVNVPLHRFKRQVSYVCGERRLRRQLLLLPGTSRGTSTRAGAGEEEEQQKIQQQQIRVPLLCICDLYQTNYVSFIAAKAQVTDWSVQWHRGHRLGWSSWRPHGDGWIQISWTEL